MTSKNSEVQVEGKRLKLSNLEKVLYPQTGFTKAQVIDYYVSIAPVLLPHLKGRPLTLKRYPEGVEGFFFYEKNCPSHRPDWVTTARIWSEGNRRWMDYCLAQDLPTLVWAANLADLELHTSLSQVTDMEHPTAMVFDLDPGPPASILQCCQVALWLRDFFETLHIKVFPKTSGSKGLQLYVPLNTTTGYAETKSFAHVLARRLAQDHADLVVSDMKKSLRTNKVFVDWSQNDEHKTTVCVYSLRARERPTVSCPVTWDEVEKCLTKTNPDFLAFDSGRALDRVKEHGDLFEPVLTLKQKLPAIKRIPPAEAVSSASGPKARVRRIA